MKKDNRIWVIGGANIAIVGVSSHKLKDYDSNIGEITTQFGGVGRNIAQACAELGEKVSLVTCFGNDDQGKLMREHCELIGIDTSFSIVSESHRTSVYLAILDEYRDMRIAMNDMRILDELNKDVIARALKEVKSDDILVIDSNLEGDLLDFITKETDAYIASDPVSAAKIPRLMDVLGRIDIFKPNEIEAKELTGIEITDEESANATLKWFIDKGIKEIIITLGGRGMLFSDSKEKLWITHKTIDMDNANGGGDAMFGAYLSKRIRGEAPLKALEFAASSAVLKITGAFIHETDIFNSYELNEVEMRAKLHKDRERKIENNIKELYIKVRNI